LILTPIAPLLKWMRLLSLQSEHRSNVNSQPLLLTKPRHLANG